MAQNIYIYVKDVKSTGWSSLTIETVILCYPYTIIVYPTLKAKYDIFAEDLKIYQREKTSKKHKKKPKLLRRI